MTQQAIMMTGRHTELFQGKANDQTNDLQYSRQSIFVSASHRKKRS